MSRYFTKTDCSAEAYINDIWISSEILNVWFNGDTTRKGLCFVPEKFKPIVEKVTDAISYGITGAYTDGLSDESVELIEAAHRGGEPSDLVFMYPNGSITADYYHPEDYEKLCEFLLWHTAQTPLYNGLVPFIVWELVATMKEAPTEKEALQEISQSSAFMDFYLMESDSYSVWDSTTHRDPIEHAVKSALESNDSKCIQQTYQKLHDWLMLHWPAKLTVKDFGNDTVVENIAELGRVLGSKYAGKSISVHFKMPSGINSCVHLTIGEDGKTWEAYRKQMPYQLESLTEYFDLKKSPAYIDN